MIKNTNDIINEMIIKFMNIKKSVDSLDSKVISVIYKNSLSKMLLTFFIRFHEHFNANELNIKNRYFFSAIVICRCMLDAVAQLTWTVQQENANDIAEKYLSFVPHQTSKYWYNLIDKNLTPTKIVKESRIDTEFSNKKLFFNILSEIMHWDPSHSKRSLSPNGSDITKNPVYDLELAKTSMFLTLYLILLFYKIWCEHFFPKKYDEEISILDKNISKFMTDYSNTESAL